MSTPNTLIYTPEHLWIKPIGENIYEIGITDYAQNLLGDIVFVE
ncbi:MAG TPA: glycine cleavage system protein H, partial [Methylophilaceae bacterium]|nr:glycine cleavage system protein H [Methylophilaceae bacterium]HCC72579.1 glycine cleavage system protein H [Methylophilaceae bacterium]